jgi:2-oxoglutarate dehydrogenase E2 component (dihydrolipoamide succinyltransferase)
MSPAVRRLLAEKGLDATAVIGSGEGGRITVDDVLAAAVQPVVPAPKAPQAAAVAETDAIRRVPHTPIRHPAHRRSYGREPAADGAACDDGL